MACAKGLLGVGQYQQRRIHPVDPDTGKILRTIESNRFMTWVDGEMWRGTREGDESELRHTDPRTSKYWKVSNCRPVARVGLEFGGGDQFLCVSGVADGVRGEGFVGRGKFPDEQWPM